MSNKLLDARNYEEKKEKDIKTNERPSFHLTPRVGWMNDPNGFSFYKGKYHMFYQYHPYNCEWGPMHWGHAVTENFIDWEYLPAVMAPEDEYDRNGCFSGSAVTLDDGRHLIMYTGVREEQEGDVRRVYQRQCVAIGDGIDYHKVNYNPLICEDSLPEGMNREDFRDPKVIRLEDGTYLCIVGSCTEGDEHDGRIQIYSSTDCLNWRYERVLAANNRRLGRMWECPDFFELDGKWILLVSPQDMRSSGLEYHNGNGTVALVGDFDTASYEYCENSDQAIDCGMDFYAPQTVLTADGRRVMIGWLQNWDTVGAVRDPHAKWFGQMSVPRELFMRDGRLCQMPVRELEERRCDLVEFDGDVQGDTVLDGVNGRIVDMEISISTDRLFSMHVAEDQDYYTAINYRPEEEMLEIDRQYAGSRRSVMHQSRCYAPLRDGRLDLRIVMDRFSVEIFVNGGERALSCGIQTPQSADGISFHTKGRCNVDLRKYSLS